MRTIHGAGLQLPSFMSQLLGSYIGKCFGTSQAKEEELPALLEVWEII